MEIDPGVLAFLGASFAGVFTLLSTAINRASSLREMHDKDLAKMKSDIFRLRNNLVELAILVNRERTGAKLGKYFSNENQNIERLKDCMVMIDTIVHEIKSKENIVLSSGFEVDEVIKEIEEMKLKRGILFDDAWNFFRSVFLYRKKCAEVSLFLLERCKPEPAAKLEEKKISHDQIVEDIHRSAGWVSKYLILKERELRSGRLEMLCILLSISFLGAMIYLLGVGFD